MKLGEWHTISGYAQKHRNEREAGDVQWIEHYFYKRQPKSAMFIGWRTVWDGVIEWSNSEENNVFLRGDKHNVYLFVLNGKSNPIYVFPEQVCEAADET